jgi:hypothetical protein
MLYIFVLSLEKLVSILQLEHISIKTSAFQAFSSPLYIVAAILDSADPDGGLSF